MDDVKLLNQDVKGTMTSIDEQLKKVISEDRIYTSKLVAHFDWHMKFKHLIIVSSIIEKRYILLDDYDEIDLKSISNNLYFYEVIKESERYELYEGMTNSINELDWLGNFSFILTTNRFNSKNDRQLIEKNYNKLIYLQNQSAETVDSLQIELRVGFNNENGKWGFCWARHDNPFYMEEGLLCPRQNCITEALGIIWCTKEEADLIMQYISLITRKFNRKGSHFKVYPTAKDFLEDFLSIMIKISNKSMKPVELHAWSSKVLSGYSVT